jgi:hypothetical protein
MDTPLLISPLELTLELAVLCLPWIVIAYGMIK